jgi:hypothetical protein
MNEGMENVMAKRKRKGRTLAKRYGHSARKRRGHSHYAEGSASVPVRVHGTLYISPEPLAKEIIDVIEESPRLIEAIAEEITPEVIAEVSEETHDYWPSH